MTLLSPEFLHDYQYEAIKDRYASLSSPPVQEGVIASGDLAVTQRGAGANMTVDVAAGRALVQGDSVARQGLYHVVNDALVTGTVTIAANASGNPRIDQVGIQVNDATDAGSGTDVPTFSVLAGTATAGATLDNRTGAAAPPNSWIRLADILVANGAVSITNTVIRDRRPWARGGFVRKMLTNAITTASSSYVEMDTTNLTARMECSGAPLRISLLGYISSSTTNIVVLRPSIDAAAVDGMTDATQWSPYAGGVQVPMHFQWITTPAAGSHNVGMQWHGGGGTLGLGSGSAVNPVVFAVEELVKQNAANNVSAGTSG